MLLNAKKVALSGLLAAFSVVLMILSSVIETSSLFFIAAASFCVGIVIRECGLWWGAGFYVASVLLNFLLAPNKMYCITLAAMSLYLLLTEWLWKKVAENERLEKRNLKLWIGKYVIFNLIYIPIIWLMPNLFLTKEVSQMMILGLWAAGQVAVFVYDYAYRYFQGKIWGKLRTKRNF